MAVKDGPKFKGKLILFLKKELRYLVKFHANSQKSENFYFVGDPFVQSIYWFKWESPEELCLMTLKSDSKFEEKPKVWFQKRHEEFREL